MAKNNETAVENNFRKVGDNEGLIVGEAPGTSNKGGDKLSLAWIGEVDLSVSDDKEQEKRGEKFVVLSDYLSGANGIGYKRGDVISLSQIANGYGDKDRKEEVTAAIRRFINLSAIRLASMEESEQDHVEVNMALETQDFADERAKRIQTELENVRLQERIDELQRGMEIAQAKAGKVPEQGQGQTTTADAKVPTDFK